MALEEALLGQQLLVVRELLDKVMLVVDPPAAVKVAAVAEVAVDPNAVPLVSDPASKEGPAVAAGEGSFAVAEPGSVGTLPVSVGSFAETEACRQGVLQSASAKGVSADVTSGTGSSASSDGLVRRAALLRLKYRKQLALVRIPVEQIGFHPSNRDGQGPSADRCVGLLTDIS